MYYEPGLAALACSVRVLGYLGVIRVEDMQNWWTTDR